METALTKKRKVLQPTSIDKVTREERFALDSESIRSVAREYAHRSPTLFMRMYGYGRHQDDCGHERQRFKTRWVCADCGMDL